MAIKLGDEGSDDIMAEINMTPLIDIMLVLLILFMVTSSVSLESGLDIDLPKTASGTQAQGPKAVIVSLDAQGALSVQGQKVDFDGLQSRISQALAESRQSLVIFEGDRQASLGRTVEIMDLAKAAGAEKFAIAAQGQ